MLGGLGHSSRVPTLLVLLPYRIFMKIPLPVSHLGQVGDVYPRERLAFCLVPVARAELWAYGYPPAHEVPAEARRGIGSPGAKLPATVSQLNGCWEPEPLREQLGHLSSPSAFISLKACPKVETGPATHANSSIFCTFC